jgi:formylglycine-generating enzyme required for sulfatase activity
MKLTLSVLSIMAFFVNSSVQASDFTNSIGMEFNTIPAGSFYMGSCNLTWADRKENKKRQFLGISVKIAVCPLGENTDSDANDDEIPRHLVKISKSFQMGVYEVTLGQFKKFIVSARRTDLLNDNFIKYNNQGNDAPVVQVSWDDAQAFIRWLNQKEGGKHYSLPTEAQWEYAARAGTTSPYSFSGNFADYAWYDENSDGHQHAVGGKLANKFGLYDMAGNVWEWTCSISTEKYNGNENQCDNNNETNISPVIRGGSWYNPSKFLRSASRNDYFFLYMSDLRYDILGFRVSRM